MSAASQSKHQMVINYVPGEECRVAIVEDGKLEELHAERFAAASRVGNIYVGRVNNVEASIQAAFVDFGLEENGFLHISDLHPRYFPGEDGEATEQVGHKTPRRERPPIQQCLRKGDEVIVQVLKEGVGTKGPTLTSYLSIPGRFLVMMPQMDKVGVSRKVEDEDLRRSMREILDQLELPEGFGFILRTAGMDRSKLELKRDLAYLQRLWKDMEKRRKGSGKARLLYSESDLLVRCLRDVLTNETDEVIIDNEQALSRAERFMKIVAPRTKTKLMHYPGKTPIFHAFGIERQIALIHAREVPLPSGGRLVIDQTEALVAIDVNSGKSRDARDAEDNAYKTNLEAVDEICRQLRLRDLGGIVVNDLIDMRSSNHRKDVENQFKERLKRDRAKTTVASISPFGILEMTRQRMRSSHEQIHFSDCPTCRGRGLVQKPDSVASESLRELAAVLDYERIGKVELVVSPRVAGELLSNKRRLLGRIERESGKHVDVRVSEDIPPDRISFYAYDAGGADVDLERLPAPKKPTDLKVWDISVPEEEDAWSADPAAERRAALEAEAEAERAMDQEPSDAEPHPIEIDSPGEDDGTPISANLDGEGRRRGRRRGGRGERGGERGGDRVGERGGRGGGGGRGGQPQQQQPQRQQPGPVSIPNEAGGDPTQAPGSEGSVVENGASEGGRRRRRRRRRGRGGGGGEGQSAGEPGSNGQPRQESLSKPASQPRPAQAGGPKHDGNPLAIVTSMGDHGDEEPAAMNDGGENADRLDDGPEGGADGEPGVSEVVEGGKNNAHPVQPVQPGEGGRRRRRRRRRGRGGGGGQNGQPNALPGGASGGQEQGASGGGGGEPQRSAPLPQTERSGVEGEPRLEGRRDGRDGRGGGGDGGRSRRGRGGRGGGGGGGGGGAGGGQRGGDRPRDNAGGTPGPSTSSGGGGVSGGNAGASASEPPKPAIRPLYFNRRKLTPAEMNKRPKPE
jgi:ribonuclease E